jgi:ketosteroid isomerase-like protein
MNMDANDMISLVHGTYKAFARGDKEFFVKHLADDFTFSAPPDPLLSRVEYFDRWSGVGTSPPPEIKRTIAHGNEVVITYERSHEDGSKGRNTEIFTISDGTIQRIEVYWGWNIAT